MSERLCPQCQGVGTDRFNKACTYCAASGKNPFFREPVRSKPGGGRKQKQPLPSSAVFPILLVALIAGSAVYVMHGASENAVGLAALAVLGVVAAGIIAYRILSQPLAAIGLVVLFIAIDHLVFDGALTPRARAIVTLIWAEIRTFFLP